MFLISEEIKVDFKTDDSKKWILRGVFGEAELKNRNGRWYPSHVMSRAVDAIQETIVSPTGLLGEWKHPPSPLVDPENACIKINSIKMNGNQMIGEAQVLRGMPKGDLLIALLENGIKMPVSTRALGELVQEQERVVVTEMSLVTVDVVYNQSCPTALPDSIYESDRNWAYGLQVITENEAQFLEEFRKKATSKDVKRVNQEIFQKVVSGLEVFVDEIISNYNK